MSIEESAAANKSVADSFDQGFKNSTPEVKILAPDWPLKHYARAEKVNCRTMLLRWFMSSLSSRHKNP